MRILLTADPFIPVPPKNYGGIERVIHMLIDGYVDEGHEVYLLAHTDSQHSKLNGRFSWPAVQPQGWEHIQCMRTIRTVVKKVTPDVIHSFSRFQYLLAVRDLKHRFILQCYQREISNRTTRLASIVFPENRLHFAACGKHMLSSEWSHIGRWHVVPNCTDTQNLTPKTSSGPAHFVFLGRIEPIKGIVEAIALSQKTSTPLKIAGNVQPEHQTFFEQEVVPHLDGDLITYIGTVNDEEKHALFTGAKAFLMLIQWEEPFGIVMAEALSCGVPILALNRGSVPEVVVDGRNGFRADSAEELIQKSAQLHTIHSSACRQDALDRFSISRVAGQYLDILKTGIKG